MKVGMALAALAPVALVFWFILLSLLSTNAFLVPFPLQLWNFKFPFLVIGGALLILIVPLLLIIESAGVCTCVCARVCVHVHAVCIIYVNAWVGMCMCGHVHVCACAHLHIWMCAFYAYGCVLTANLCSSLRAWQQASTRTKYCLEAPDKSYVSDIE